jgi:hypothetical protein
MAQLRPKLRETDFVARIRRMASENHRRAFLENDVDACCLYLRKRMKISCFHFELPLQT